MGPAQFLLHAFLALPSNHYRGKVRRAQSEGQALFSHHHQGNDDGALSNSSVSPLTATLVASPVSAATGKVIEGPSNAEMRELTLKPEERVVADTGTLLYMSDGVSVEREFRGGSFNRLIQGGRLTFNAFTNLDIQGTANVALAPAFPSRILPVQLEDHGNTIIGNVHSFLAAPHDVELDYERATLEGPRMFNRLLWNEFQE